MKPTAVLWVGAGQDSTALLYKFCLDPVFREKYLGRSDLIAVMSDTGNEYPDTYLQVEYLKGFCKRYDLPFYFITNQRGFHGKTWQTLTAQMDLNANIFSVALPKTCTDNLKIKVCDNFLEDFIKKKYGFEGDKKKAFYQYQEKFGERLVCMIGLARGEESRQLVDDKSDKRPKWKQRNIETRYPLIDLGMDRQDCQNYINSLSLRLPFPSCCMFCPFQNEPEILYLFRFFPHKFQEWKIREAAKLEKHKGKEKNLGVKGKLTLEEYLKEAIKKYGDWTDKQLIDYKMSHGHCVKSKY